VFNSDPTGNNDPLNQVEELKQPDSPEVIHGRSEAIGVRPEDYKQPMNEDAMSFGDGVDRTRIEDGGYRESAESRPEE